MGGYTETEKEPLRSKAAAATRLPLSTTSESSCPFLRRELPPPLHHRPPEEEGEKKEDRKSSSLEKAEWGVGGLAPEEEGKNFDQSMLPPPLLYSRRRGREGKVLPGIFFLSGFSPAALPN